MIDLDALKEHARQYAEEERRKQASDRLSDEDTERMLHIHRKLYVCFGLDVSLDDIGADGCIQLTPTMALRYDPEHDHGNYIRFKLEISGICPHVAEMRPGMASPYCNAPFVHYVDGLATLHEALTYPRTGRHTCQRPSTVPLSERELLAWSEQMERYLRITGP